jgi:hypothetical protein
VTESRRGEEATKYIVVRALCNYVLAADPELGVAKIAVDGLARGPISVRLVRSQIPYSAGLATYGTVRNCAKLCGTAESYTKMNR